MANTGVVTLHLSLRRKAFDPERASLHTLCMSPHPNKPHRLDQVFHSYDAPVYFVTFCTAGRKPILANEAVHAAFRNYAKKAEPRGIAVGRYVIMLDHIHCFIRMAPSHTLGTTVRMMKRALTKSIQEPMPHWQPGFFDHLLRHSESYAEKWHYVLQNPVRAGLVERARDWMFQGEVVSIQF
ncbi:transposase [Pontiellaceae bacterium B12227]|nr:transposase [Pontiellaceae bacterium B12227]